MIAALALAAALPATPPPALPATAIAQPPAGLPPIDPALTPYRAEGGSRRSWGLDLANGTLIFRERSRVLTLQVPRPQIRYDGFHVEAEGSFGGFKLDVHHGHCRGWRGASFPDVATVRFNGRTLHGCGGTNLPSGHTDPLDGTRWRLSWIDKQRVGQEADVTLDFARGRVLGRDGCNAFGATYVMAPARLKFHDAIATETTCRPGERALEQALWAQLGQEMAVTATKSRLYLRTADGHLMLFKRQDPLQFERTRRWKERPAPR